jgi:hypothetical protein
MKTLICNGRKRIEKRWRFNSAVSVVGSHAVGFMNGTRGRYQTGSNPSAIASF